MKAFVMKEIGRVGFMDKPIPRPGPNGAVIQTTSALICTSDSHTVGGGIGPREDLTLGHEAVGIVHEVGVVPDDMAVYCCDMLSTGFVGAENGNIPIGGTVAVLAQGPVGLMSTAGARLRGAGLIIGVESVPERQELARTYGADEIVDFTKEDAVGRILDLTDSQGVHTSIEALGADVTFQAAVKATKPGGTVSNTG